MSRFIIAPIGTRGDFAPLLDVGLRLRSAGHEVVMAAHCIYKQMVLDTGLELRIMGGDVEPDPDDPNFLNHERAKSLGRPDGLTYLGEGMIEALIDEPADAILITPISEAAGHALAEAKGIPAIGMRLAPQSATVEFPPALCGGGSFGRHGNRRAAEFGAWMYDTVFRNTIADMRRMVGLPKVSPRELRRRRDASEWLILNGYSPTVSPRPRDWRRNEEVTGYWWPPRPANWEPPAELVDFLDSGPAPVFVGFGSTTARSDKREEMSEIVTEALRRFGGRAVVQDGWLQLDITGDDVLNIGSVPYDWLFPRISAAIHHAGAGTTSASLRAGIPAAGVPGQADQGFWAQRLIDHGVSPGTISLRKMSADSLVGTLRALTTDGSYRANAARLAAGIAQEDGAGAAVKAIEDHMAALGKV
ncbi:glycosyltransferase [Nocardia stercoris]|uniref:Glycosyltransferase n=1 Tax=Nocardia stercoris TaxID=2483361 RepID=A0A3M2L3A0_9NOCA|nr:glycosyltransferase [Nocardia stercoris]RMI31456.1 glycosyltransferase [Nocardia stercoris]